MQSLIIDSTMETLYIGLIKDNRIYSKRSDNCRFHNSIIMELIDDLLQENETDINSIDVVACVTGPGSFTGIRIGVSTANAISYAIKAKRVEINALQLVNPGNVGEVNVAFLARANNYYYANILDGNITHLGDIEKDELDKLSNLFIRDGAISDNNYFNLVSMQINNSKYVDYFEPNYLKQSQAERLKNV